MSPLEGIIKYNLDYTPSAPLPWTTVKEISHWRQIMVEAKLIGQDPDRYSGYGFGNISCRLLPLDAPSDHRRFVISGTQTGHKRTLTAEDFCTIESWDLERNSIVAHGPMQPSSESLTHAVLYGLDPSVRWVIHVHCPELWHAAGQLQMPQTHSDIPNGTVAMTRDVKRLFAETPVAKWQLFAMGGHEDGLVAFGPTARSAANAILNRMA